MIFVNFKWAKGTQLHIASIKSECSGALTTDSAGELHILGHDGDSLGVDGAKVGVLEETDHVGLGSLLESKDSRALETEVVLEGASDVTDESLEGELADEEFSGFLEFSDFSEGNSSGSESVGSLDTTGAGGLGGHLGGDVLAGLLSAGALAGGHLGTGHLIKYFNYSKEGAA